MGRNDVSERQGHQHRGRFTEGLLNSKVMLKALNIKAGQTILDAGCGNGYISKLFSDDVSQSGKVYALDTDTYFIETLKNEIEGTNIEAMEGDITAPTKLDQIIYRPYLYIDSDTRVFEKTNTGLFM